ncbi:hypothetical protein [Exiguobacterium undae]|uniref:Lipoprotein n=1 Tax=Exiguobacterium undae TaxID=169177 RepID=A0ABX2VB66_9BACL|nr:hypothetical protein [Exiguobacterium undae]OAN15468.1 hypothetical protein A3783_05915 [Exiguobacterium undae]
MRRTIRLLILGLFIVCVLSGCSHEEYVIEEIQGDQLSLGPEEQDPEASYALTEVMVDDQTKIDGRTNPLSVLKPGDIIRFEYRKDKQPLVATIERVN